jgi:hypothetical protein
MDKTQLQELLNKPPPPPPTASAKELRRSLKDFEKYHGTSKEIQLKSKVEDGRLYVFYNEKWVQLTQDKNKKKFYEVFTLRSRYSVRFCHELGLIAAQPSCDKTYFVEYYEKNRDRIKEHQKGYYEKNIDRIKEKRRSIRRSIVRKTPTELRRKRRRIARSTPTE